MKVIAEIGVNHDGKLSKAKKLIKFSKLSGADYVKFQLYKTENLVITNSSTASYQKKISNNQYELLKKYELSLKKFKILFRYCLQIKIQPLVTCFDLETFKEVNSIFKFNTYKIGSGDLDNFPLIYEIAKCNKKIILSTGMSSINEINLALKTIYFSHKYKNHKPNIKIINNIKLSASNLKYLREKVIILHCISNYPAKVEDLNLNVISYLKEKYKLKVGFSDHSKSTVAPSVAMTLGAEYLEKHITISNSDLGPDHEASLNYKDFKLMVKNIDDTKKMYGDHKKKINFLESQIAKVSRKSIYAKNKIKKNEIFNLDNLIVKRPQSGKKPYLLWNLLGKRSKKVYKPDELIIL